MISSLLDFSLGCVMVTVSILSLTFLGTLLGDVALVLVDWDDAGRSLEVLILVSLSNVSDLVTVLSAVCLSSGWLLLVGRAAEVILLLADVLCRHSITAVSATRWS